jgi:hypothetical protein
MMFLMSVSVVQTKVLILSMLQTRFFTQKLQTIFALNLVM